ncbi:ribbon-helix-helix domain-containing protein [Egbenema bharatensis]|uniref:ribbon-helix-helix domain-containing protein n=1 Tax=Egbenema bharatensis TaxID=3463334 RepID=UPI003A86E266
MTTNKERVTLYIPGELKEKLVKLAEKDRRSLSVYIEVLVRDALARRGITVEEEE